MRNELFHLFSILVMSNENYGRNKFFILPLNFKLKQNKLKKGKTCTRFSTYMQFWVKILREICVNDFTTKQHSLYMWRHSPRQTPDKDKFKNFCTSMYRVDKLKMLDPVTEKYLCTFPGEMILCMLRRASLDLDVNRINMAGMTALHQVDP